MRNAGLRPLQLSRIALIPIEALDDFLIGEADPTPEQMEAIADICGVSREWLIEGVRSAKAQEVLDAFGPKLQRLPQDELARITSLIESIH